MKKSHKRFETFEHTADIGLRVFGKDDAALFSNAAFGLLSLLISTKDIQAQSEKTIKLVEDNVEELFVSWLNEILFYVTTRNFIPKKITIDTISQRTIIASLHGETKQIPLLTEIKAATYHELEIKETEKGLEARVIFDT